jgi:hypothetical protein
MTRALPVLTRPTLMALALLLSFVHVAPAAGPLTTVRVIMMCRVSVFGQQEVCKSASQAALLWGASTARTLV